MTSPAQEAYDRLFAAYGPQGWWPGDSPFEVLIGAVLVQNTAWRNVEKALVNLREAGCLNARRLYELPLEELAELIRPAGYYRVKAQRLRNLLQLVVDRYDGKLDVMFATPPDALREQLLGVHGVGPETADAIMLYAAQLPSFVADTYAHRVLARHGWLDFGAGYGDVKAYFEDRLPADVRVYNEYHALLVEVGKRHCKSGAPQCDGCPLQAMLPDGGPLTPE